METLNLDLTLAGVRSDFYNLVDVLSNPSFNATFTTAWGQSWVDRIRREPKKDFLIQINTEYHAKYRELTEASDFAPVEEINYEQI